MHESVLTIFGKLMCKLKKEEEEETREEGIANIVHKDCGSIFVLGFIMLF